MYPCSHFLCLLTLTPFITHPSFTPPSLLTLGSHYVFVQKAHHPIFSIFLLNLVHSLHIPPPFLLTLQIHFLLYIHYPTHSPDHPIIFYPLHSTFLTPERTFPYVLSVFLTRPLITLLSTNCLFTFFFLFIRFIHVCYHPILLLCQTEISSSSNKLCNLIPTAHALSVHPSPLTFSHPFSRTEYHSSPIKMHYKANKTKTTQGSPIDFCMENSLLI